MPNFSPLMPRKPVPALKVALAGGGPDFDLAAESPEHFTLLIFYRGLHCPICKGQLKDLEAKLPDFAKRGVNAVAVSCDSSVRAEQTKTGWGLANLRLGYGLGLDTARAFGLYLSASRGPTSAGVEEPAFFCEPGLFLVRPDRGLYFGSVQTMPFARPQLADILTALDFVIPKNYPARGEIVDLPA